MSTHRDAFEKFLSDRGIAANYEGDGQYAYPDVQLASDAWQAALASIAAPSQPQQEAVPAEQNEPMSQADIERELFGDGEAGMGEG